jgi:hypothetical protein
VVAIGGCTVQELKMRMSNREEQDWRRFFMIFGPVGDRRLDEHFAYLRHDVIRSYAENPPDIDECRLEYDYRRCFPKDLETELEELIGNVDADIAKITTRKSRL